MSSDLALRIDGLGKKYTIRHKGHDHVTLAQAALHRLRHPRGGSGKEDFWALRDVSFEVPRGQVLGVIGHNGAGKSTLLKILSRITPPTTGRVEVYGRIGSLLEVGTGFHPELTGRENIYLNGSILGMRTKEINRQFDAIVDFSGVEKFLDTPVKRYSSGMYVRLAFAVAAHLDTEILLMDEVLAVGDAEFQAKCLGKVDQLARYGRTVLLVTHQHSVVERFASVVLFLDRGVAAASGPPADVLPLYEQRAGLAIGSVDLRGALRPSYYLTDELRLSRASAETERHGEVTVLRVTATVDRMTHSVGHYGFVVHLLDHTGRPIGTALVASTSDAEADIELEFDISGLVNGTYGLTLALTTPNPGFGHTNHDVVEQALGFSLLNELPAAGTPPPTWGHVRFGLLRKVS